MEFFCCVLFLQATRHARRVYVGGLPPMANEQVFFVFYALWSTFLGIVEVSVSQFGIFDMI